MNFPQESVWIPAVIIYAGFFELGLFYRILVSDRILAEPKPGEIGAVRLCRTFVGRHVDSLRGLVFIAKLAVSATYWLVKPQESKTNE